MHAHEPRIRHGRIPCGNHAARRASDYYYGLLLLTGKGTGSDMNSFTLIDARSLSVARHMESNSAIVAQGSDMDQRVVDGVIDVRWIPLLVPLLGAVTASMPFLVVWGALTLH